MGASVKPAGGALINDRVACAGSITTPLRVSLASTLAVVPPVPGTGAAVKSSLPATTAATATFTVTVAASQTPLLGAGRQTW
ncbi:hypothetical protein [Stenotrophomonas cyclobalanopsidis]